MSEEIEEEEEEEEEVRLEVRLRGEEASERMREWRYHE